LSEDFNPFTEHVKGQSENQRRVSCQLDSLQSLPRVPLAPPPPDVYGPVDEAEITALLQAHKDCRTSTPFPDDPRVSIRNRVAELLSNEPQTPSQELPSEQVSESGAPSESHPASCGDNECEPVLDEGDTLGNESDREVTEQGTPLSPFSLQTDVSGSSPGSDPGTIDVLHEVRATSDLLEHHAAGTLILPLRTFWGYKTTATRDFLRSGIFECSTDSSASASCFWYRLTSEDGPQFDLYPPGLMALITLRFLRNT
jgi:hypothetical protein